MNTLCTELEKVLALGGGLSSAQRAHAGACPRCRVLIERFRLAERLLADSPAPPPWLAGKTLARLHRRMLAEAFLRESFPWKWVVLGTALGAAAVALFVYVGFPHAALQPLPENWGFTERHLSAIGRLVRVALAPLSAVAFSILPFLVPTRGKRTV